jgi:hypothetical protein
VLCDEAHRIAGCLGDDHDLAVLATRLSRRPAPTALRSAIAARRRELQDRAMTLREHLFPEPPGTFVDSIGKSWKKWRRRRRAAVPG